MRRVFNFSSGPAVLPVSVLHQMSQDIIEIDGCGMSILEISHRSEVYEKIHRGAMDRLLRLMGLSASEYAVLFLGGGASLQFSMLPMNFLNANDTADFAHTGEWSAKAIAETKRFGKVHIASSSEASRFCFIDHHTRRSPNARYFHLTTNNTIEGTQWSHLPETGDTPLIADASSDILSLVMDWKRFSLIYAGAQKNLGPAGVTVIIAKKTFLSQASEDLPTWLQYKTHLKAESLYNTPPVFSIYGVGLVLKWIEEQGGIQAVEKQNRVKADIIYSALDSYLDVYEPTVSKAQDRSMMNITFRLRDPSREEEFLKGAQFRSLEGLKGHRSVGGFRASVYNAFPIDGAIRLAEYLKDFARS